MEGERFAVYTFCFFVFHIVGHCDSQFRGIQTAGLQLFFRGLVGDIVAQIKIADGLQVILHPPAVQWQAVAILLQKVDIIFPVAVATFFMISDLQI